MIKLRLVVGAGVAGILMSWTPYFEGVVLRGYKDPIGIVTACSGHTKTAIFGRSYTPAECSKLLEDDLVEHATGVKACVENYDQLTIGERAAAISFAFNVGVARFCGSTFKRKLEERDPSACDELLRWIYAAGVELPGLVERRKIEREVCLGV